MTLTQQGSSTGSLNRETDQWQMFVDEATVGIAEGSELAQRGLICFSQILL
jgi:hypothetical protein